MSLELRDVAVRRGRTVVLEHCSVSVGDGEWLAIVGATGSGRSTLAETMAGLRRPASGTVLVDGVDVQSRGARCKVGLVMQRAEDQFLGQTVFDDIAYGFEASAPADVTESRVRAALEAVGFELDDVRDRAPTGFSGGQRKRLALAAMLVLEPSALILDEPFAGLDAAARNELTDLLVGLTRSRRLTVVTLTSDLDQLALATKAALLANHGIPLVGTLPDFVANRQLLDDAGIELPERIQLALGLRHRGWNVPIMGSLEALETAIAAEWLDRHRGGNHHAEPPSRARGTGA